MSHKEYDVFLAHSLNDIHEVKKLYQQLRKNDPQLKIYFSDQQENKYESQSQYLIAVPKSKVFCCCFKHELSEYFRAEIDLALTKRLKILKLLFPDGKKIEYAPIDSLSWIEIGSDYNTNKLYQEIVKAIDSYDGKHKKTQMNSDASKSPEKINGFHDTISSKTKETRSAKEKAGSSCQSNNSQKQ